MRTLLETGVVDSKVGSFHGYARGGKSLRQDVGQESGVEIDRLRQEQVDRVGRGKTFGSIHGHVRWLFCRGVDSKG